MRLLFALLVLSLFTAPVTAQRTRFKAYEHLEGYEECRDSEFADLYELDPFEDMYGEFLDDKQLSEVRARWAAERKRVASTIERLDEPIERAYYLLTRKLTDHRYFREFGFRREEGAGPFVYLIPKQTRDPQKSVDFYDKWLIEAERIFREEYIDPLGIQRKPGFPAYFVCILPTEGAYKDYADALKLPSLHSTRAHYNPELKLAVTYRDLFGGEDSEEDRRAAIHEVVHALEHAYTTEESPVRSVWFSEGLAQYLSYHQGLVPRALTAHMIDRGSLHLMLGLAQAPTLEVTYLPPIQELVGLDSYGDVFNHFLKRAQELQGELTHSQLAMNYFYGQASLWMHYLHQGEGGKHKKRALELVRAMTEGVGGAEALALVFDGVDMDVLNAGFRKYVNQQFQAQFQRSAVGYAVSGKPKGLPGFVAPVPYVGETRSASASTFEPHQLAPDRSRPEVALALALSEAAKGRYSAAAADVRKAIAASAGDPAQARLTIELERLEAMVALRRTFLEHLPTVPKKLILNLPEGKLVANIAQVDEEFVHFADNRLGVDKLALDKIDGSQLADLMGDRRSKFKKRWLFAYPEILERTDGWKKLLRGAKKQGAVLLKADATEDYPTRMHMARAASTLTELSRGGLPKEAATARTVFERISTLMSDAGQLELVQEKLTPLRALATKALELVFEAEGLADILKGNMEQLGEGQLRLTYDFDDPEQLEDFITGDDKAIAADELGRAPVYPDVNNGALQAVGYVHLRHIVSFHKETSLTCSFRYDTPDEEFDPRFYFMMTVCDDGQGNLAAVTSDGSLRVIDRTGHMKFSQAADGGILLEREYELGIRADGERIHSTVDGSPIKDVDCGPRKSGRVSVLSSADFPLSILSLRIEGTVDPQAMAGMRGTWIDVKLKEAGF